MRDKRWFARLAAAGLALLLVVVMAVAAPARAAGLFDEFDARPLDEAEKRLLQIGLAAAGTYLGLADGRWGPGSQSAFEGYAVAAGMAEPDGKVLNLHMAALGLETLAFIEENHLVWRGGEPFGHRMLAPEGAFLPEPGAGAGGAKLEAGGVGIRILSTDKPFAAALHEAFETGGAVDYRLRRDDRLVTTLDRPQGRVYLRSDWSDMAGAMLTTVVEERAWAAAGVFEAAAGSLALRRGAETPPDDGLLLAMMRDAADFADSASAEAAPPTPEAASSAADPGERLSTGTAFFINNHDLVTAAHVIEGCARVARVDGAPLKVAARHPNLDLALLTSEQRSRSWIALGDGAQLGQRVFALGYPFFGRYGTGLNMTAGNVSAVTGLRDDPDGLTITAPVQPGNSGGPLVARDGRLVGVVVSRLDHLEVAEATGAPPENMNFAVEAGALLTFLSAEGVALPPPAVAVTDVEDGLPQGLQDAVAPVVCLGP